MSANGKPESAARRPEADIPVLTEVVDAAVRAGLGTGARSDALIAEIARAVLEELTPRLEETVHEAVRSAVGRALAAPGTADKNR